MKRAVAVGLLTPIALSACEWRDPVELNPDMVVLEVLLVAGESEARMLAVLPHRGPEDAPPELSARLRGPGSAWEAAFSETLETKACRIEHVLYMPAKCLRAALPEPIRAGAAYRLRGTAPLGTFTGETRVPDHPVISAHTLRLGWSDDYETAIPLRYRAGSDIGSLSFGGRDIFLTLEDGTEIEVSADDLGLPQTVAATPPVDTAWLATGTRPARLHLLPSGLGWEWTNMEQLKDETMQPWPNFGIEGEGVYGYFSGMASSQPVLVFLQ